MGWIWLVRIGSIVFGRNYLHGWFSIHPALPARENCETRAFGEVRMTEKLCGQNWNQVLIPLNNHMTIGWNQFRPAGPNQYSRTYPWA